MRSTALIALVVAGFASLAPLALAHPPADDPVVDENLRTLSVIVLDGGPSRVNQTDPHTQQTSAQLGLSLDPNATRAASTGYAFSWPGLGQCWIYYSSSCPKPVKTSGAYVGDDFQVELTDQIQGNLHLAWSFRSSQPASLGQSPVAAVVRAGLNMGDVWYDSEKTITLKRPGGDANFPLTFSHAEARCHPHENQSDDPCPEDRATSHDAHHLSMWITIEPVQGQPWSEPFGSQMTVKLDTGGGSFLVVRERPPPPPAPEPVAEPVEFTDEAVIVEWEDTDGDGQSDIAYVPGPGPLLAAAALAGALVLRRRNR